MKKTRRYALPVGAAAGVLAIGLVAGPAVSAQEGDAAQGGPPTITMDLKGKAPVFNGPETVRTGQKLRIVNNTSPKQIGPHTFSLVKASLLPNSGKEFKNCFTPGQICMSIALAHDLNPKTEKVGKANVNPGGGGWNTNFTAKAKGDSWYTEKAGAATTRTVTAKAGTTLSFLCAVHPDMQGEIRVLAGE